MVSSKSNSTPDQGTFIGQKISYFAFTLVCASLSLSLSAAAAVAALTPGQLLLCFFPCISVCARVWKEKKVCSWISAKKLLLFACLFSISGLYFNPRVDQCVKSRVVFFFCDHDTGEKVACPRSPRWKTWRHTCTNGMEAKGRR